MGHWKQKLQAGVGGDFVVLSWEEDSECSIPATEPSGLYQKEDEVIHSVFMPHCAGNLDSKGLGNLHTLLLIVRM